MAYWNGAYTGTTSNLKILGTITTGTWNATTIGVGYGGTGKTSWTKGGILYASATNALAQVADGTANTVLRATASSTYDWLAYTSTDTANTLVYRDANRGFSAGTISISKAGETGVEVNNTQATNPN